MQRLHDADGVAGEELGAGPHAVLRGGEVGHGRARRGGGGQHGRVRVRARRTGRVRG